MTAPLAVRKLVQSGAIPAVMALEAVSKHGADAAKVLTTALVKANSEGKTKATARHMPGTLRINYMKKTASAAYSVIYDISVHQSFGELPTALQDAIKTLIAEIPPLDSLAHTPGTASTDETSQIAFL